MILSTGMIFMPPTRDAWLALLEGKYIVLIPDFFAVSAILIAPLVGRMSPLSASSPANIEFATSCSRSCPADNKIDKAIGRS